VFKKIATTPVDHAAKVSSRSRSDETVFSVLSRDAHVVAVSLLSTRDPSLLASALVILRATTSRAFGESRTTDVARSDCFYFLVAALREYDAPFDRLATDVLQNLLRLEEGRDGARAAGAVRVALELIRAEAENEGAEASAIDERGGDERERDANARVKEEKRALALRVLCALLHDRAAVAEARAAGAPTVVTDTLRRLRESAGTADETATACLCCSALTKLAADDDGGEAVARADGVYALGRVLIGAFERSASHAEASSSDASAGASSDITEIDEIKTSRSAAAREETCAHAFRALRFVFSCDRERVRVAFKTLFPPDLFAAFIDVGQYKPELDRYAGIASRWLRLPETSAARFADALEETGKRASGRGGGADGDGFFFDDWRARLFFARDTAGERPANAPRVVRGYALVECLGEGAFGKVHRAHKTSARGVGAARAVKEMFPKDERASFLLRASPRKRSESLECRSRVRFRGRGGERGAHPVEAAPPEHRAVRRVLYRQRLGVHRDGARGGRVSGGAHRRVPLGGHKRALNRFSGTSLPRFCWRCATCTTKRGWCTGTSRRTTFWWTGTRGASSWWTSGSPRRWTSSLCRREMR
jgi:NIMA (never in mitosis gene a)-related kinase